MNDIAKMVLITTIISSFSAVWLAGLEKGLKDRISQQEDSFIRGPAITVLLKGAPNDALADRVTVTLGEEKVNLYPWVEDGKVRRVALERAGHGGYGGDVVVMTAVDFETNKVYGAMVTQHKETPGVGTRAMEPSYLKKYINISATNDIKLKSDGGQIDALSGATKSSVAVASGVNQAAQFVMINKEAIVKQVVQKTVD